MKKYALRFTATLLMSSISFQSCETIQSNLPQGNHMEVMVSRDISKSSFRIPHPKEVYRHVLTKIRYDETETYFANGATVYFSTIGLEINPTIAVVSIPKGTSALTDNLSERRAAVDEFKTKLKQAILTLLQLPMNEQGTNLATSLAYQMDVMRSNGFSDFHSVLLITDGIESGVFDFNSYDFSSKTAFNELSENLDEKVPLGSLKGFDFTILSSQPISVSENDDRTRSVIRLSVTCQKFWEYHLNRLGADVRIRSNLINA